jgi:hypothetical protein
VEPRRKYFPSGTLLLLPSLPLETTEADIVDVFDRAGMRLSQDRIEIRPLDPAYTKYPDRVCAIISLPNSEVAKLVQATFARHGTTLPNQRFSRSGWKIKVASFGTKGEDKICHPAPAQTAEPEQLWPPSGVVKSR